MKVVIIEDELASCRRLERMLIEFNFEISATLTTVKAAIKWFENNSHPNLVFVDIQLADGLSFEIFKHVKIDSLLIITTAYHEYSIQAFEYNSISYLLKPIKQNQLKNAIEKARKNRLNQEKIELLQELLLLNGTSYKNRFTSKIGNKIKILETSKITYFHSTNNLTFAHSNNIDYCIDYSLSLVTEKVNPKHFFRINRSHILHINSIQKVSTHTNNRLKIYLPDTSEYLIVSRERVKDFKKWLNT